MQMNRENGYLEIILGSMYSKKTTTLINIYNQCTFCNIPVAVINHSYDTRYHDTLLSTHDKQMIPCIQTSNITNIWDYNSVDKSFTQNAQYHLQLRLAKVILINEAQFFEKDDIYNCVFSMLENNKKVYVCGLDGDFQRKKFGHILDLIPLCDKVTKLTSLCSVCKDGTPGIFTSRLTSEKMQTLIGSDNYIPVCRKCYSLKDL
jgi:thymidine kinase